MGTRYYTAYLLELYTGLRRGETLGLRWKDIDFKNNSIQVMQQLVKVGTKHKIRELKTENSQNRRITIPDDMIVELKRHRKQQQERRIMFGLSEIYNDLIFTNELESGYIQPRNFIRSFKAGLKKAGLNTNITYHDMRYPNVWILSGIHLLC